MLLPRDGLAKLGDANGLARARRSAQGAKLRRARTSAQGAKLGGANEFPARLGSVGWGCVGALLTNQGEIAHALRWPVMGRPAYDVLFGIDGLGLHIENRIFGEANLRNLPAAHPFTRQRGTDPLPVALGAAGATLVPQYEFRRLDDHREPDGFLVD